MNLLEAIPVFALVPAGEDVAAMLPVDPVCRMSIDPERAAEQIVHRGAIYYFCSPECASAFRERPGRYTGR